MSKAISPAEVAGYKAKSFPDYVFEAFNELIAADFTNQGATVKQAEVVALMIEKAGTLNDGRDSPMLDKRTIFDKGYLNVEEVYREQGWNVMYDKPGYNEDYGAYFEFRVK